MKNVNFEIETGIKENTLKVTNKKSKISGKDIIIFIVMASIITGIAINLF